MRDYPHGAAVFTREDGAFVYYDDYEKLEQRIAELEKALRAICEPRKGVGLWAVEIARAALAKEEEK
jgi:hypothetical protein